MRAKIKKRTGISNWDECEGKDCRLREKVESGKKVGLKSKVR